MVQVIGIIADDGSSSIVLGGDVTGPGNANTVSAIQGIPVSSVSGGILFNGDFTTTDNGALTNPVPVFNDASINFIAGIKHFTSPTIVDGNYDSALRIDMSNNGGGLWDVGGTITGSEVIAVDYIAGNRGTHEIIAGAMNGLGAGDATPFSFGTNTWGGA